jgi:NAD+ synthase
MTSPANRLVLAMAQIGCLVGDVAGNAERIRNARAQARGFGADLVMFSELFLAGYPPKTWS